jgi:hypothetical protein
MAGSNSTITLQEIVDDAASFGDLAPALATGGWSNAPALSIANDVMAAMLLGGPDGQPFNWKWNRMNLPTFPTVSWQQDYLIPDLINLAWLEYAWASDINNQSQPKPKFDMEVHRDLEVTTMQTGYPAKLCWIPPSTAITGTWGQQPLGPTAGNLNPAGAVVNPSISGMFNPGPGVIYTNPVGQSITPINPTTGITDPNGNLWVLTTYGTCGSVEPTWPSNPTYPTQAAPDAVSTTVTDGTCVWTAVNPNGQAFRLNPIPPQQGTVWLVQAVGQKRVPKFTSLSQTLDPVPDDYSTYFKQGFFAQCFRRSPDSKVRAKFPQEWQMWLSSLDKATRQGQREMDDFGFYPSSSVMDSGWAFNPVNPAQPYGPYGY